MKETAAVFAVENMNRSPITKTFEKMSEKYEEILQSPIIKAETLIMLKDIGKRYVKLDSKRHDYDKSVNEEISTRTLDKDLYYNKEYLNIKLKKFHEYESSVDYYTF